MYYEGKSMGRFKVKENIMDAQAITKELPQPLRKQKTTPFEFPIKDLPDLLKQAAIGLHDKIQAPIAICVQSILASANLAVQGHANSMLPFGQERPVSCFFLSVAESGERKSSCDNEAMKAVKAFEEELRQKHDLEYQSWKNAHDAFENQRKVILKQNKGNASAVKNELDKLGKEPEPPLTPLLVCPEATFEGLCKLMVNGQPSMGVFSSEGGQFIGGHGMKEENKIRTAAALSEVWDGNAIKRVRSVDGTTILNGRRICLHLMAQPRIASTFLSDAVLKDQGLLSRMLVASPVSTAGTRLKHNVKDESFLALEKFTSAISDILAIPLPTKHGFKNELQPRVISFESDTAELFYSFSDHIEERMGAGKDLESIKGLANKLPEHATRIAATLALMENIYTAKLELKHLMQGINIALYYANEALRIFDEGMTDPNILLAEKLLYWLHNTWDGEYVSLPDIYQLCSNAINTKGKAKQMVSILEGHNWLEKVTGSKIINGKTRREVWKVIREV
jgi:hypothetical protein